MRRKVYKIEIELYTQLPVQEGRQNVYLSAHSVGHARRRLQRALDERVEAIRENGWGDASLVEMEILSVTRVAKPWLRGNDVFTA